jgi:hypothetical protein
LGWLFYREPFGAREAVAMAIIFTGVALVKRYSRPLARDSASPAPAKARPSSEPLPTGRLSGRGQ